jgi:predicted nucleic acid-binding protein
LPHAFDTNILAYADGVLETEADIVKRKAAWELIDTVIEQGAPLFVPAQVLIELHDLLVRKRKLSRNDTAAGIALWQQRFDVIPTSTAILNAAIDLSSKHRMRIFDAVILAAAAEARCDILYSEDMQHGFAWRGVEVVNPFL